MVFALLFFSVSVCVTNIGVFFFHLVAAICVTVFFFVHSRFNCSAALALVSVRARAHSWLCVFVFCHLVILKVYVIASTNRKNN